MKPDYIDTRKMILIVNGKKMESSGFTLEVDLSHKKCDGWPDKMVFELTVKNGKKYITKAKEQGKHKKIKYEILL